MKAELDKRGLTARVDTGGSGDIHTATYKSYHTTTPNGFDLQSARRRAPIERAEPPNPLVFFVSSAPFGGYRRY